MRRTVLRCLAVCGLIALMSATLVPAGASTSVRSAQYQLNRLGCDAGPVDGVKGAHTTYAVIRFQAANHLPQTGNLDTATRAKLGPNGVPCNRRRLPSSTGSGKRIVLSQLQNWVWLVNSNGTIAWQAGIIDNPSELRPGTYYAGSKCGRPAKVLHNHSANGLLLEHYVRFAPCGIGFHRVPMSGGTQIHPDWMLGTNARQSHGCIRLSDRTAEKVWSFVVSGTRVVVVGNR